MSYLAGSFIAAIDPFAGGTPGASALPLGKTREGFEIEVVRNAFAVTADDLGPDTVQEFINAGGNVFINAILLEWNAQAVAALTSIWSVTEGAVGPVGCPVGPGASTRRTRALGLVRASAACGTDIAPAEYYFRSVIVAPNFNLPRVLSLRPRELPIRLQALPDNHLLLAIENAAITLGGDNPAWYTTAVASPTTLTTAAGNWSATPL